jgi:hypothetical protein
MWRYSEPYNWMKNTVWECDATVSLTIEWRIQFENVTLQWALQLNVEYSLRMWRYSEPYNWMKNIVWECDATVSLKIEWRIQFENVTLQWALQSNEEYSLRMWCYSEPYNWMKNKDCALSTPFTVLCLAWRINSSQNINLFKLWNVVVFVNTH